MRILHVYNHFYPSIGGIEKYIEDLCLDLIKLGHRSDVCCLNVLPNSRQKLPKSGKYKGIRIYRLPCVDLRYYKIATNVPRLLNIAKKYDIIHIYGVGFFSDVFSLTKKIHGKPFIVSTVGGIFHTKNILGIKTLYFGLWCRLVLKAAKIVAISQHDKKLFSKISRNIELIPVPVETDKFNFHERKKSNLTMLYIGRISKNKRVDRLIDVVKILAASEPGTKLYIVGRDWEGLRESLEKHAASSGVGKNVEFVGEVSDKEMLEYINRSTFFLSASEYESFGISAVEAMSSGLIVVLNGIDSFRYFVHEGENGFIADYSRPEEVANLIKKLNKADLSKISKKAHERVEGFKPDSIARKIEKLYMKTVK